MRMIDGRLTARDKRDASILSVNEVEKSFLQCKSSRGGIGDNDATPEMHQGV